MDAVAGLLDGPRARGAFLLRSILEPPWALSVQDGSPLTVIAVLRGHAWILPGDQDADVRLEEGAIAVINGRDPYRIADDPCTEPQVLIHPGNRCSAPDGSPLEGISVLGVRTWGSTDDETAEGATVMLTGTYEFGSEVSRRLLAALPRLVVHRVRSAPGQDGDAFVASLATLLADEVGKDLPGQEAVLDRLLDLLLIATLRSWFDRPDSHAPGWYAAHGDPIVGAALRLLQHEPAQPWTVERLARATGASRATLARRFHDLVGEPPMTFLTHWRLTLASDLLLEPGSTIASVARQVGYGSAFAFSAAFKRGRGMSPAEFRAVREGLDRI